MKRIAHILNFKSILLLMAVLPMMQSCDKKGSEGMACPAGLIAEPFRFIIVDKSTGENLFFSNTPLYTTDQISYANSYAALFFKPRVETSAILGKHFSILVGSGTENTDILKIHIADKLAYTIEYTSKLGKSSGCPISFIDKIIINGNQKEENIRGKVILLKM